MINTHKKDLDVRHAWMFEQERISALKLEITSLLALRPDSKFFALRLGSYPKGLGAQLGIVGVDTLQIVALAPHSPLADARLGFTIEAPASISRRDFVPPACGDFIYRFCGECFDGDSEAGDPLQRFRDALQQRQSASLPLTLVLRRSV